LRIGLSVSATIEVRDQSGPRVANASPVAMRANTGEDVNAKVDALIRKILAANAQPAK